MRVTIQHYFDFGDDQPVVGGDLIDPDAWDALRTSTDSLFSLPADREEWERIVDGRADIRARAEAIDAWLGANAVSSLASYGVGGAKLELALHRIDPNRRQTISDYAPETVERLRELFPEVEVQRHDLRSEGPLSANVHLFHRIETEFGNAEWRAILGRFSEETVLLVPDEVISYRRVLREVKVRFRGRTVSKAGLLRNQAAFESLWGRTHAAESARFHDLDGWILRPLAGRRIAT